MALGGIVHVEELIGGEYTDTNVARLSLTPSTIFEHKTIFYTDTDTETFHLTPVTVLEFINNDGDTELFKLTPSGADTADYVPEATTVRLAFTPSAPAEGIGRSDTATEYVKFTPSGGDALTHTYFDAGTVYLAFTPSTAVELLYHFCGAPSENYKVYAGERWIIGNAATLGRHISGVKRWYGSATTC